MKQELFKITENRPLTDSVMRMRLEGDTSAITSSGQFVNIKLEGLYLRRPISVFDRDEKAVTIIYKVVGKGTEQMKNMTEGTSLDVLTGLGNGYDLSVSGDSPLLIGGGVGVPPMYLLAKELIAQGKKVSVILGFNIEATEGTAQFLKSNGIRTHILAKIETGSDEIQESIRQGHIAYVINTSDVGAPSTASDGYMIRKAATESNVTIFTSLDTVKVLLDVLDETTLRISTIDA